MSKIATAKKLAANIRRLVDALPYDDAAEVERVYNLAMPLVDCLNKGLVATVTADGLDTLREIHDILDSDAFTHARHLADTVQAGDVLEVTLFATGGERARAVVTKRPAMKVSGFYVTYLDGSRKGEDDRVNLFWPQFDAAKLIKD